MNPDPELKYYLRQWTSFSVWQIIGSCRGRFSWITYELWYSVTQFKWQAAMQYCECRLNRLDIYLVWQLHSTRLSVSRRHFSFHRCVRHAQWFSCVTVELMARSFGRETSPCIALQRLRELRHIYIPCHVMQNRALVFSTLYVADTFMPWII